MLYLAVSLLSGAALAHEVLLLRLFSITQGHHFAFMVISLALLGYGASGTFLALAGRRLLPRWGLVFASGAMLFGVAAPGSFALAQRLPFNMLELAWDPRQLASLGGLYLLLAIPFFSVATSVGAALAAQGLPAGRIYRADLLGAGAGAALVVLTLFVLRPSGCLRLLGAVGFAAAAVAALEPRLGLAPGRWLALGLAGLGFLSLWPAAWTTPRLSAYRGLSQALRVPGTEILAERSSPLGLLTVVGSPQIPFRHAPGLSLACTEEPPEQLALFTDGDRMTAITRFDGNLERLAYLDWMSWAAPYAVLDRPRVLVLGAGGGAEVLAALYHRAASVDAVELNAQVIGLLEKPFGAFTGHLYGRAEVAAHAADERAFVRGSARGYDLIQLAPAGSAGGGQATGESYLATVEAFGEFLSRLEPGGVLAVTCGLELPPRGILKLFATAVVALEGSRVPDPGSRLALVRSWSAATLLVRKGPWSPSEIARLRGFCEERWFDVGYYPGMTRAEANRYNRLEEPYLFDAARSLLGPDRAEFLRRYKFSLRPATDDRPFFSRFFRWKALPELLRMRGRGGVPLVEWGYLILVATLLQALVLGFALIFLPLWRSRRRRPATVGQAGESAYFGCLGFAFLFLEIAFLQRLTLFLGNPLYAAAVVLSSFLVFAGLGSGRAERWVRSGTVWLPVAAIAALCSAQFLFLPQLLGRLSGAPDLARAAAGALLLAPLAFFMGMPFPAGIAKLKARVPERVPWAWAVNGWTSVVGAVLASVLAIHVGFAAVVGTAVALYAVAGALYPRI